MQCVVTGASSGIGRAIAIRFAEEGAERVIVHFHRNRQGAAETAAAITALGVQTEIVQADISVAEDRARLCDQVFAITSRIDAFVHNAGADVLTGAAGQWSFAEKLECLWKVDVAGTIALARQVAAEMLQQPTGAAAPALLFIGWDQAPAGMEGDAGQMFGPIKAAVMAFSRSLAQTLAPQIRVNCVAPGWIQTAWGETADSDWQQRARQQALMQRWGQPADVAAAAAFLCRPAADFITGQILEVNGGWNRRPAP
jgi:3-oxoacyl-[acyl-carrier protein] reductase